ncbi:MAG: 2,3-epoxybenzoyl-CoA dihydrolase [Pseudomonadales bacterium]|nr:2,3-epoxybenzoyl-CoA dihydrolase [Pseudomonadales bacterium]
MSRRVNFVTQPDDYRHWQLRIAAPFAYLELDVDEQGGWFDGYELKLNSYDIGVDIELADVVQRLRFEHPEVKAVLLGSARLGTFCAGANIRMLGSASHAHKVNFCKFTNETRNTIEDATRNSGQTYIAAINGTAAGGGFELALAAEKILLVDDGKAAVSLPEIPMLAVLPGTGGLTRLVDKRRVRRDIADVFCTLEEGMQGLRALKAGLVDETIPSSRFQARCQTVLEELVADSDPTVAVGVVLPQLEKNISEDAINYSHVNVRIDRDKRCTHLTINGPETTVADSVQDAKRSDFWPLLVMRELDDAILELRFNELEIGTILLYTKGVSADVLGYDAFLHSNQDDWFAREVQLYIARVLSRVDLTSRSIFARIEPDSCFSGFLAELAFAADRSYMLEGQFEDRTNEQAAMLSLSASNFGSYPMVNGLSRLQVRFLGAPTALTNAQASIGIQLQAVAAEDAGLITAALDNIDYEDELRMVIEERAGFSPDALTAMEANLRFAGPETMESKIFSRLSAWQNWIFQRPNAVGENGALGLFGTGQRPHFDKARV